MFSEQTREKTKTLKEILLRKCKRLSQELGGVIPSSKTKDFRRGKGRKGQDEMLKKKGKNGAPR